MKLQNEGRDYAQSLGFLHVMARVPVERSHAISAVVVTEEKLDLDIVKDAISKSAGCKLYDNEARKEYPMPVVTSDQDIVYVGSNS